MLEFKRRVKTHPEHQELKSSGQQVTATMRFHEADMILSYPYLLYFSIIEPFYFQGFNKTTSDEYVRINGIPD